MTTCVACSAAANVASAVGDLVADDLAVGAAEFDQQ